MAENGYFAREMNVGWKEWTHLRHPVHTEKATGAFCSCSKHVPAGVGP